MGGPKAALCPLVNTNEQEARSHHTHQTPPKWWTASLESSWNGVKKQAIAAWDRRVGFETALERHKAEQAIAFGFGARDTYLRALLAWSDELDAVKQGWEFATQPQPICL